VAYNGPQEELDHMRTYACLLVILLCVLAVTPPALAQGSHTAPQAAIDAALQEHVAATEADRVSVQRLLEREEIKAVAGQAGLDLKKAADAVATMNPGDLARVASQAKQVEQALAGGQSRVTISTTFLIIALLVLILLIVALK
jgi:hypothetical protein